MKNLTKLALVSAMAMSSSAFALQTLGDEELSQATGQDGITIKLEGNIGDSNTKLVIHDRGGFQNLTTPAFTRANAGLGASTGTANAVLGTMNDSDGAIVLDGFNINLGGNPLVINVDADANGTSPLLNVNIALPSTLTINTGAIKVAKSGGINASSTAQFTNAANVLDNMTVTLKNATLNVQLGTAAQGAFIKLNSSLTNGLSIANLNIFQPGGVTGVTGHTVTTTSGTPANNAAIRIGNFNIKDSAWDGTANSASDKWTLAANINVADDGMVIQGLDATNVDVRITDLKLGNAAQASVGNVAVLGLKLPSAVTISGH